MEVKTCLELNGNDEDDEINNAAEQMIGNSEFWAEPKQKAARENRQSWPFCSIRITVSMTLSASSCGVRSVVWISQ